MSSVNSSTMADVGNNTRMENVNMRKIQTKLLQWELQNEPLAPLTNFQRDVIFDLSEEYKHSLIPEEFPPEQVAEVAQINNEEGDTLQVNDVESTQEFLEWYEGLEQSLLMGEDTPYLSYWKQLEERKNECDTLLQQVDSSLGDFNKLSEEYNLVSTKTNALHSVSEQLLADQMKLHSISEEIKKKLHLFSQVENLSQRLNSPTLSVSSEAFFTILTKIDECMDYLKSNPNFKESHTYLVKYRHCLSRAVNLIRSYVNHILAHATEQVLSPRPQLEGGAAQPNDLVPPNPTADTAFALFFGKFQAAAPKLKDILKEVEDRVEKSEEYANLLNDCQQCYLSQRAQVIWGGVENAIKELTDNHKGDHCTLMRSACSFLIHISQDEWDLFFQFFTRPSPLLTSYLSGLCNTLYDTLRPYVIHINHLETLAELCTILKIEMLEEHVNNNPEPLGAFGKVAAQLLQDSQERLAYRAHVCLRSDVLNYKPAPGDLAYPEKLLMMEQIAISLHDQQTLKRSDSHTSMASVGSVTSQEVATINNENHRYRPAGSPADLHGMWYPGVRRTLATLSRLYRCLERPVFQGLSQEALTLCVTSVANAAHQISANKTNIDGKLFQIKHLLILREQIAPFQVDFTVKETTLDFSKVKNAAYGLIQKRNQLFSMNSNNALLEFLLEGTPIVKELLLDSRKEVDRQLKASCETFIKHSTEILAAPLLIFLENTQKSPTVQGSTVRISPEQIAAVLIETQRLIKSNLAPLQRSMQLYLANKETEFILFRPIRNNVVGNYMQIEQLLNNGNYSTDDIIIASCPTPEQVSVLLSSASLLAVNDQVLPFGSNKRKVSATRPTMSAFANAKNVDISSKDKTFIV